MVSHPPSVSPGTVGTTCKNHKNTTVKRDTRSVQRCPSPHHDPSMLCSQEANRDNVLRIRCWNSSCAKLWSISIFTESAGPLPCPSAWWGGHTANRPFEAPKLGVTKSNYYILCYLMLHYAWMPG